MTTVRVGPGMPIQKALAIFKKKCAEDGTVKELRAREYHLTKSQKRRVKSEKARIARAKLEKKMHRANETK